MSGQFSVTDNVNRSFFAYLLAARPLTWVKQLNPLCMTWGCKLAASSGRGLAVICGVDATCFRRWQREGLRRRVPDPRFALFAGVLLVALPSLLMYAVTLGLQVILTVEPRRTSPSG